MNTFDELATLRGKVVIGVGVGYGTEDDMPWLELVDQVTGGQTLMVWICQDEEGNGPGYLMGLDGDY